MARLSDVPRVLSAVGLTTFTKRVWVQIQEDNLMTWAAALAYSWLFAVFPFLIFVLSLLPYLLRYLPEGTKDRAVQEINQFVHQLPKQAADTIWNNIETVLRPNKGGYLLVGLGVAIWAASGGMAMTMAALDKCYEIEKGRPFYRQRPLALLLTLSVAVLLVAVVVLLPVGTFVKGWVTHPPFHLIDESSHWLVAFDIVRWLLALLFMVSALTLVYHVGPAIRHQFHWLTPGAVFCLVVWIVLGLTFRLYIDKYGKYEQTYGTVGGVAILLLFFYVDALVLLIGAEINSEIDFAVLHDRVAQGHDPLPEIHDPGEIERFHRQLKKHGATFLDIKPRNRGKAAAPAKAETSAEGENIAPG
jgi:membrane protein